ncbi:multidrug resistance efflux pump [Bradyrhizobium sp. i1.3.1]
MADQVLKFQPEQKSDSGKPTKKAGTDPRRRLVAGLRRYRRFLLLVVLPLVVAVGGLTFYLNGGRYVGTDDAYVGAQKVLVTPDISGKIQKVVVREGQIVKQGDELFEIDPVPFRLAVDEARAQLMQAQSTYDNLRANIKIYGDMLNLAQQGVDLKQRDVERKQALVKNSYGSQLDLDNSANALVTSGSIAQYVKQQISTAKTQLLGDTDLPLEKFPPYAQAKSKLDNAERNLDHAVVRASMGGVATQVEQIQLGRYVTAGTPVFSIIDVAHPWGRRQSEGERPHPRHRGTACDPRGRRVPEPRLQGQDRFALARHRRAIRDPAAAERHRQFRQGGTARACQDLFRRDRQIRAEAEGRHERLRHHRHWPQALARRPVRIVGDGEPGQRPGQGLIRCPAPMPA